MLEVATTAGAVTVADGRMLADPEFAALDDPEAYLRIVDARDRARAGAPGHPDRSVEQQFLDDSGPHLLARCWTRTPTVTGRFRSPTCSMVVDVAQLTLDHYSVAALGDGVNQQLERLLGWAGRAGRRAARNEVRNAPFG